MDKEDIREMAEDNAIYEFNKFKKFLTPKKTTVRRLLLFSLLFFLGFAPK